MGQHHHGGRAHPQGLRRRGLRATTPLVLKPDGTKYGKTESGTVWLDPQRTSPFAMYQFFVNTRRRTGRPAVALLHLLGARRNLQLDSDTASHPERRQAQKALARAVVAMVHGEAEVTKCEEASGALFSEEIAGLSEDMLLAVTEDAPTTDVPRAELLDGDLSLVDAGRPHRPGQSQGRGPAHHRAGRGLRQQRAAGRRRPHPGAGRPAARPLRRAAQGPADGPHRPGRLKRQRIDPRRRHRITPLVCARHARIGARPHLVRRRGPGGLAGPPHVGLGERHQLRCGHRDAGGRQRPHRQGGAQRRRRRSTRPAAP